MLDSGLSPALKLGADVVLDVGERQQRCFIQNLHQHCKTCQKPYNVCRVVKTPGSILLTTGM